MSTTVEATRFIREAEEHLLRQADPELRSFVEEVKSGKVIIEEPMSLSYYFFERADDCQTRRYSD